MRAYIPHQHEHHRRIDFPAELLELLLRKHGVEFDERYVLDSWLLPVPPWGRDLCELIHGLRCARGGLRFTRGYNTSPLSGSG